MGQTQMRHSVAADAPCSAIDMDQDRSVLVLLQHCRDMRRQETRLRLVTLLLLLSCVGLFIFTRLRETTRGQQGADESQPSYSKQQSECLPVLPPVLPTVTNEKLRIKLVLQSGRTCANYSKWGVEFGKGYSHDTCSIKIPEDGFYSIHLRISLRSMPGSNCEGHSTFHIKLFEWRPRDDNSINSIDPKTLLNIQDSVPCRHGLYRTLTLHELFLLDKGDHLRVQVQEGNKMITDATFGVFLL